MTLLQSLLEYFLLTSPANPTSEEMKQSGHALQPSYQLSCPPLDTFRDLDFLIILWRPELHTIVNIVIHRGLSISTCSEGKQNVLSG